EGLAAEAVAADAGDQGSERVENDQQEEDLPAVPARHRHDGSMRLLRRQPLAQPDRAAFVVHALLPEGQRDRTPEPGIAEHERRPALATPCPRRLDERGRDSLSPELSSAAGSA